MLLSCDAPVEPGFTTKVNHCPQRKCSCCLPDAVFLILTWKRTHGYEIHVWRPLGSFSAVVVGI
jgi:hypothetical protein